MEQNKTKTQQQEKQLADVFNEDQYFEDIAYQEIVKDKKGNVTKNNIIKKQLVPAYQNTSHLQRCKIRTAKLFGVSIKHLEDSYKILNGKKIDGIFINDLIDRTGFSNGNQLNRQQLVEKYKLSSIQHVEVAFGNLKDILKYKDVAKEYNAYMKKFLLEKEKEEFETQTMNN